MNTYKYEGLWEELSSLFSNQDPQVENLGRLIETGNHASLPKCRNCHDREICLDNGPKCSKVRKTSIKG